MTAAPILQLVGLAAIAAAVVYAVVRVRSGGQAPAPGRRAERVIGGLVATAGALFAAASYLTGSWVMLVVNVGIVAVYGWWALRARRRAAAR